MPQFTLNPSYMPWLSKRLWYHGFRLFSDGTNEDIKKIASKVSRVKEVLIKTGKFQKEKITLLYVSSLDFPLVPSVYWYNFIDQIDGEYMRMLDFKNLSYNYQES